MGFFDSIGKGAGKTIHFLKDTAVGIEHTAANAADVVNAGVQGVAGLGRAGYESLLGTDQSYQDTLDKTKKAMDYSLNASRGAYTPEEASSNDFGKSFLKPLARNVATYAPLALGPEAGFAGEGAGIGTKLLSAATTGAGVNTASTGVSELADTGHIDPKALLHSAVMGAALGAGGEVVGTALRGNTPLNELGAIGKNVDGEAAIQIPVGKDSFITTTRNEIENLAKADSVAKVKSTIGDALPQDVVDRIAPAIVHTSDPNIVQNIISKGAESTLPVVPVPAPGDVSPGNAPTPVAGETPAVGQGSAIPLPNQPISAVPTATPPAPTVTAPVTPPAGPSAIQNVVDALRGRPAGPGESPIAGIENLQAKQAGLYSAERSQRLAQANANVGNLTGEDALHAQLIGLNQGKLPRVDSQALVEHLQGIVKPEDVNGVLDHIRTSPNLSGYEPITAQNAIRGLFAEGKLPAPKEWELIQKAAGSDFTDAIKSTAIDSLTNWQKIKNFGVQVLGMPKSILASMDLSGGGRQGAVLGSRFMPEWVNAQKESVKFFASTDAYKQALEEIGSRADAPLYQKMKLNLASAGAHEEQFASTLGEKIPGLGRGIAASDRAYTGGLTLLRADAASHILEDLRASGIDPATLGEKQLSSIGQFINTASGRGSLGALEKHATSLGEALFSPRLWKSRLDMLNPVYYAKLDPIARKYALQSAASFASIAGTVLTLAAAAGAKVETDARSSDFLKIKVGDTRYDILGGFQQNLVLAWRELSGEKKNSLSGNVSKLGDGSFGGANRLSILSDFIQNKENPVFSTAQTLIKGTDKAGNKINPVTEVGKLAVPLPFQDTYKAVQNTGNVGEGVLKSLPGEVGVGVGTYGKSDIKPTAKQQAYIEQLKTKGAGKDQIAATTSFYQTLKTGPDRNKASTAINDALAAGDQPKAQKLADDYNTQLAGVFKDWVAEHGKFASDKALAKDYNARKIRLTSTSVNARLKNIKTNPLYAATTGGGQ